MGSRRGAHKGPIVWQKALNLAVEVHRFSQAFPTFERFGLAAQIRRAAISIPSNIAEGAARRTTRDFVAFLHIARGSCAELETQLLLAKQFGYATDDAYEQISSRANEVGRLLTAVISALRHRVAKDRQEH